MLRLQPRTLPYQHLVAHHNLIIKILVLPKYVGVEVALRDGQKA